MLYALHEPLRRWLAPFAEISRHAATALATSPWPAFRLLHANHALADRLWRAYPKLPFDIPRVMAHGREVAISEQTVETLPFCRLVRFARTTDDADVASALESDPAVLLCAPLSGHHATLLRDTITSLAADHDVYVTDWTCAREVPVSAGTFDLAEYVGYLRTFMRRLRDRDLHMVAVCQAAVPALAAVALDAAAGADPLATLTLMAGPIDARKNPTQVNRYAVEHDLAWFEGNVISAVPAGYAGSGRRVYPGFLQLAAFVQMNAGRHAAAYLTYWLDALRGDVDATRAHERFYDEFNAVLDMDAAFYLDTVGSVFQEFALARGTWELGGELVRPGTIRNTRILTIEGERDDICGIGQTAAALELCTGLASSHKHHLLAASCGHYGVFSGSNWREQIYPRIRAHIRSRDS